MLSMHRKLDYPNRQVLETSLGAYPRVNYLARFAGRSSLLKNFRNWFRNRSIRSDWHVERNCPTLRINSVYTISQQCVLKSGGGSCSPSIAWMTL